MERPTARVLLLCGGPTVALGREDNRRRTGGGLVATTDVGADPATIARLAGSWPGLANGALKLGDEARRGRVVGHLLAGFHASGLSTISQPGRFSSLT
jgi:hypothetical protein